MTRKVRLTDYNQRIEVPQGAALFLEGGDIVVDGEIGSEGDSLGIVGGKPGYAPGGGGGGNATSLDGVPVAAASPTPGDFLVYVPEGVWANSAPPFNPTITDPQDGDILARVGGVWVNGAGVPPPDYWWGTWSYGQQLAPGDEQKVTFGTTYSSKTIAVDSDRHELNVPASGYYLYLLTINCSLVNQQTGEPKTTSPDGDNFICRADLEWPSTQFWEMAPWKVLGADVTGLTRHVTLAMFTNVTGPTQEDLSVGNGAQAGGYWLGNLNGILEVIRLAQLP